MRRHKIEEHCFYQGVQCVIVRNQNLSKSKKLLEILCFNSIKQFNTRNKMNEIVNKFWLARYKFMPEMHLRQPRFTYSACGSFIKNKERRQKFKETGDWQ